MAPIQPPQWHRIYPKSTPIAYLTDIITSHARAALARARNAADELHAATRESMNLDDVGDAVDDAAASPVLLPHVNIDASLEEPVTRRCASTPQEYLCSRSLPFPRVHQIPDGRCYGVKAFHSTINWETGEYNVPRDFRYVIV